MKKLLLTLLLLAATPAWAMDESAMELQIRRLDDIIGRMRDENDTLKRDIRAQERDMAALQAANETLQKSLDEVLDEMLKLRNTDIANLQANQKKLYDKYDILNWGTEKRDCAGLGKHQQIKATQSPDGNYTLRYLCFDGRAIHLGTEVHQPPAE